MLGEGNGMIDKMSSIDRVICDKEWEKDNEGKRQRRREKKERERETCLLTLSIIADVLGNWSIRERGVYKIIVVNMCAFFTEQWCR